MKKHFFTLFLGVLSYVLIFSCTEKTVHVDGISVNPSSVSLVEGETSMLSATVSPSNADNKQVIWSSNDNSTVMVDATGKITAMKAGNATVTVTTSDGGLTAFCHVTVTAKIISVSSISLDKTSVEMFEGESMTIKVSINPSDATDKSVIWKSSNEAVATVNSQGKVTALTAGKANIKATANDGGLSATCIVSVKSRRDGGIDDYNNENLNW